MLRSLLEWLGFAQSHANHGEDRAHGHDHSGAGGRGHGHTHGTIDATIATTERGIWAIKWSFLILGVTSLIQLAVVAVSGSIALLADTIHNIGDAATAIPLWIAFRFARRRASARFTYGYGRVEDFAGVVIVLIILASALVAAYEAVDRLIHPQTITLLGWVAFAGIIGFVGNEAVAVFRIRVGRQINSAALIADGYHARTDGLTSLAVVIGAAGVWLGFPLADPIIGLLITFAIFAIVWQSSKAVFTRMLDGVEPDVIADIRHAAQHVPGVRQVLNVRARWLGHRLTTELDVAVDGGATLREADAITTQFESELFDHMPALSSVRIRARPNDAVAETATTHLSSHHHHAPNPISIRGRLADGVVAIVDTNAGERMAFTASRMEPALEACVEIARENGRIESLPLSPRTNNAARFLSSTAPEEPHEFDAQLVLRSGGQTERLAFRMVESKEHRH